MNKRQTLKYNRKIKREALKLNKIKDQELAKKDEEIKQLKLDFYDLIGGISQQVIDTVDAGMEVTIHCKISGIKLLELLRR